MPVDIEVGDEAAGDAGRRLTSWLVEHRIVAAKLTDCVFGAEAGYPPGENYVHAIGKPSAEPGWRRNGVEIHVGRQVYWGADLEAIRCRRCGHEEPITPRATSRWDTAFSDAINDWCRGAAGLVSCLGCGADNDLNDWDWGYPWAFGALGVTFLNWDHLSDTFIAEVGEFLGHRVVYTYHKL